VQVDCADRSVHRADNPLPPRNGNSFPGGSIMVRHPIAASALALASVLAAPAAAQAANVQLNPQNPVIELNVTEEVRSAPDIAVFSTGVQTSAPTASEALRRNSAEMAKVVARLKALGVKPADIQTSGISLGAEYDFSDGQQRFKGYQASNSVSVTARDIAKLGELLDALVAAGATNINGPSFMLENDSAVISTARQRALQRATAQARSYAQAAGYSDVRLLVVSEGLMGRGPVPMMAKVAMADAVAAPAPPVEGGQVGSTVSLGLTFEMVR
jgi:uncharacterized protein YggE